MTERSTPQNRSSRRELFKRAAVACAAAAGWCAVEAVGAGPPSALVSPLAGAPPEDYRASAGRIRHSVQSWCYNPMPPAKLIAGAARMGLSAMEGIDWQFYPAIRKAGMQISLVNSHGFVRGMLNPDDREYCLQSLRQAIDHAVEFGAPGVITFTGMRHKGISDAQACKNCVEGWKQIIGYAEQKQVNLCLEHLNTRDNTHPMKGHPGYFGDNVDLCIDLIKRVDSPRMKLLFDIYHVQIMHGDVIRHIRQYKNYIAHIHTAGVPGRGEIDDTQELNYPAIMRALLEVGYQGYVAHEVIPTWSDPLASLRHAVRVCDV